MLGLFVINYFIMGLTRYAHDLPFGMILDALIFYNILIISLQAMMHRIEWKRASSGLTVVAAIWMAYCILEIVNPESVSVAGWFSSVRSIAFYFFFIVVLTQLTMTEYKYLKYMLAVWSVLTLIAVEKSRAELAVMKLRKQELDQKYTQFSPVGSTLKRKGREINFSEQSYLSILTALNTARLRQKNLQMTSATLKIINPPVLPINAEPNKRRLVVAAAFLATFLFVLGFFILLELLDRTLRDKVRAERITGGRVIGAFPGKGRFGQRRYAKQYREIAARYIGNAAINYFEPSRRPNILNILSTEAGDGKSTISEQVAAYLREADMKVRVISWNKDFDVEQKSYLLAGKLEDFVQDRPGDLPLCEADVVLVEYPPFSDKSVPKELLRNAALNIVIAPANRTWKDTDQLLFEKTEKLAGRTPVTLCLNCARRDVVQSFTGLMRPYSRMRRLGYQISQFGFTAVK